jgi:two-component system OmpR family response regulator
VRLLKAVDVSTLCRSRRFFAKKCFYPALETIQKQKGPDAYGKSVIKLAMEKLDHILVVDDDEEIRDLLRQYLEKSGFELSTAANGRQMRTILAAGGIDLIVLDLMMPQEDGLALCRELSATQTRHIPILMLTARNEEADRILGLEMGADDDLSKPFSSRELLARIRAILRRSRMIPEHIKLAGTGRMLRFANWTLDTHAHHLLDSSGAIVPLSSAEYRLLMVFLDHPQRVLTRDQLLGLTQNREADYFDRSIDILVSRLRKRLHDVSREPLYIKTLRSEGYIFCCDVVRTEDDS